MGCYNMGLATAVVTEKEAGSLFLQLFPWIPDGDMVIICTDGVGD